MSLNAWLSAAKRHLKNSSAGSSTSRRRSAANPGQALETELLEQRSLLTTLIVNDANADSFTDAAGTLSITNAELGTHNGIVIEDLTLDPASDGIFINLSGVSLERLAIETVTIDSFDTVGIDINLTNVTDTRTISIEDVTANGNSAGLEIDLVNTSVFALTIEDSSLSGVDVHVNGSSSILTHGLITENTIVAPAETTAVMLTVDGGGIADDFQIINNIEVTALNRDAVLVNITDSPTDGLVIDNNVIGNEPGADVIFRAEGDTFVQPFELTNNATDGELLETFELDLRPLGLVFDPSLATGQPFNAVNGSGALTGATPVLSNNNQVLTVNFTDFQPGETLQFVIDVDLAPLTVGGAPRDFSTFGRDLIGAAVQFRFGPGATSGSKVVSGTMIGDAEVFNASQFARGAGSASDFHGVNLNLSNSPLTNASISSNTIIGVAGNGILLDADQQSDVSAVIQLNTINSSGQDGVHLELLDSNFTGAIVDNTIGGNSGYGVNIQPNVSRRGDVESVLDSNPVIITSTNHQLQTGDQVIIQGMVNDDPTINHPGNGLHTVTRIDNNRFSLQGVDGRPPEIVWGGGGTWYVPDFQVDGSARGLVQVDLQATQPQGRVQNIQIISGVAQVTSLSHGLTTGDIVRISGAAGTGIGSTQAFSVTVLDDDNFTLDGVTTLGTYDTSGGLATFTTNIVENATNSGEVVLTSRDHGLLTGDLIRVTGVTITEDGETLPSSANGRFTVTKLTDDTFALQGSEANGVYTLGSGFWVPFEEEAFDGNDIAQAISGNSIDGNGKAGIFVELTTGTQFNGDIVNNTVLANAAKGVHIESQSFGLGLNLPLDPNDPFALPDVRDVSFDVNIGTSSTDGNDISGNTEAGIVIEALNFATGSFEIRGNTINANLQDSDPNDPYEGDGIVVRLASDQQTSEATAFLSESVIEDNQIGVDARGNEGNGLSFSVSDRTRIQDLEVNNNFFLNSGLDGFHFERTEDADLNTVIFEGNDVTNNAGDGFDVFAQNTVEDEIDFRIRNSNIDNNGEYGLRINVQADARIDFDIAGTSIRQNGAAGNGFNPNDGDGAGGQSGGIGIRGFQQVEVDIKLENVRILDNIGDGFSVDATNFFDSLQVDATIIDSAINGNTLTGLRSVGAAFGTYTWTRSDFINNGTDGARIISNVDTSDFFNRRVGGQDIDVIALGNNFQLNGDNGVVLGMGVNAVFGNGDPTENFANEFGGILDADFRGITAGSSAGNGEDGLKIVQESGPYLREAGRQRVIQTDGNVFTNNAGDGVDIGHDTRTEAGNVLHGDEVVSDVHIILTRADISDNGGDGVEYLGDSIFRVPPVLGSGQDNIPNQNISSLTINQSFLKDNGGRGVDFLNRVSEDSRLTLRENEIIGNGLSGVYVVNTASQDQAQSGPEDALTVEYGDEFVTRSPNIEFRAQDNLVESNGTSDRSSTVTINDSNDARDNDPDANPDYHHLYSTVPTTLGGIVLRVGTAHSGFSLFGDARRTAANPEAELGLSGIDAEIWKNSFDGNFGADVYFDNFVSAVPDQSNGVFDDAPNPTYRWNPGDPGARDPLSRLDLTFRENTGNSLDVINGFAFLDNDERLFKSRIANGTPAPNGDGPFGDVGRDRNATRTLGFFNDVGDFPTSQNLDAAFGGLWAYDGWGTPTWRVESDFEFNDFQQTSAVFGLSDFFDEVILGFGLAEEPYQWDTGVNVPGFVGATPFSLDRGDVFNVLPTEDPIAPDQLEENDNFSGATALVTDPITGAPAPLSGSLSVNSLTTDGVLSIERKGDRDYYSFVAAASGDLEVVLGATDLNGDALSYLIYEIDETRLTTEVALIQTASGDPIRTVVTPGTAGLITVSVTAGTTYVVEVLSNEFSNLGTATDGKPFVYGTARSYDLTINAPIGPAPLRIQTPVEVPSVTTNVSSPGILARANVEGEAPRLESLTQVDPDPTNTSVDSFTVTFSEDVTGVDLNDFRLTRDGISLSLSGAILDQINPEVYQVSNLAGLTAPSGDYEFTLIVAGSNIRDTDASPLQTTGGETEAWTTDNSVNFFGDTTDNIPGDGSATDVNGNRSLRAAVNEANANDGVDIIELDAGTYTLQLEGRFEDLGLTGDLDIRGDLIIRGTGASAADTVIDGLQLDRVFHVFPGVQLTLENLTVQGGEAFDGGGIFVEGISTLTGESASTGGSVTLLGVNLIDNEAYNQGGGIYNLGTLDIDQTSISRNVAGSRGGAIFNHGNVSLLNTTVSTNHAVSRGGGIYNETLSTAVNTAVAPVAIISTLEAVNSTIALNTAEAAGGGIFDEAGVDSVLGNTIVDLNTAAVGSQVAAPISSLGFNYIGESGVAQTKALLGLISTDLLSGVDGTPVNAGLNALTNATLNGTFAHIPNADSVVVDNGNNLVFANAAGIANSQEALVQSVDQLGSQRLIEADADGVFQVDIGAVEFFLSQPVAVVTATPNPAGAGETVNFDGSASTHTLGLANRQIVNYEWDFDFDGTNFTVDASGPSATTTNIYPNTGTFVAALRVTDDTGATDLTTIVITVAVPNQPVITGPFADGTSDSTPVITWTGGSGQFNLVLTNTDTNEVVITETGITDLFYVPSERLPVGNYSVVVTAVNASGEAASEAYTFSILRIALTDPLNFDQEFDTTPEITFNQIPDAVRYQVWISEIDPDTGLGLGIVVNNANINAATANIPGTDLAAFELTTPLAEGRYRVWVRAIDAVDNPGDWSTGSTFDIVRPTITGPALLTGTTFDSTPTITWTDVGANQYQVWLTQLSGTDVNGTLLTAPQLVVNTIVTGTSFVAPLLGDGVFRVWTRGVDDDGEAGLWSDPFTFRKDLRQGPIKESPINSVNVTDRTPVFQWQAVEGAAFYDIWVNQVGGASQVIRAENIPHVDGVASITFTDTDTVLNSAVYRWWVRAFNEDGQATAWGNFAEFFIPVPINAAPVNGTVVVTTNLPRFEWTGVPEYETYELWVNNLDSGQSRVLNVEGITETFFVPTEPLENANFRWWVRATDAVGNISQWSRPTDFSIDSSIDNAPVGIAPSQFAFDNTPTFEFVGLPNVTEYELLIKNLSQRGQPEVFRQVITPTQDFFGNFEFELPQTLSPATYRWWVRGVNADGTPGPYGQPLDFAVTMNVDPTNDDQPLLDPKQLLAKFTSDTGNLTSTPIDTLHSITVHPMGVVAAHHATVDETVLPVEALPDQIDIPSIMPDTAAAAQAETAVDAIMEELAVADWLMNDDVDANRKSVADVASDAAVVTTKSQDQTSAIVSAAGLAMLGGKSVKRKLKSDERN